jgi:hypothetical protein
VEWSYQHAATAGIYFLEQRLATTLSLLERRYFHHQEASCFHFTHKFTTRFPSSLTKQGHLFMRPSMFQDSCSWKLKIVASRMDMFIHPQHPAVSSKQTQTDTCYYFLWQLMPIDRWAFGYFASKLTPATSPRTAPPPPPPQPFVSAAPLR